MGAKGDSGVDLCMSVKTNESAKHRRNTGNCGGFSGVGKIESRGIVNGGGLSQCN